MQAPPQLPGDLVPKGCEQDHWLKRTVAGLCGLEGERFPGSQPVSFGLADLGRLEKEDYWVCEKSDGVRVLLFICPNFDTRDQMVYIIDRKNDYRQLQGFYFPHPQNPVDPLRSTLIDAELVTDVDPRTGKQSLTLLAFDCLLVDSQNVMSKPLDKRYGAMQQWFHKPYSKMLIEHPHTAQAHPFGIKIKQMRMSYHAEEVFHTDIPALHHGNDGLIYTPVTLPYKTGQDLNTLKWKPPSENSIDFKLVLRFPPSPSNPREPNFHAKPIFMLHEWMGENSYKMFDVMHMDDEEWETLKASGQQVDDRVVEVHWESEHERWRMMRFRDDKHNGNHSSVIQAILQSIKDGVEQEILLQNIIQVRISWKRRHGEPVGPIPPARPHPPPQPKPTPKIFPVVAAVPPVTLVAAEIRYGPFLPSRISKVGGPDVICGMKR